MKRLVFITPRWPESSSSAAGRRILDILNLFSADDWQIEGVSPAQQTEYSDTLPWRIHHFLPNERSFDKWISDFGPDVVLFDRFMMEEQFGWRVEHCCPNAMRILETSDLHSLREARRTALHADGDWRQTWATSEMLIRELACILRCDLTFLISPVERQLLVEVGVPESQVDWLPFLIDDEDYQSQLTKTVDCVSIGNFLHAPNWDAVQYLHKVIWPGVRRSLPNAQLHVYGAYMPDHAMQLHKPNMGFHMLGRADNALEAIGNAKLLLAPLRFGAGQKGKVLEAAMMGTASVNSPIAAEGMLPDSETSELADDFIPRTVRLLQNDSLRLATAQSQWATMRAAFYKPDHQRRVLHRVNTSLENLTEIRNESILMRVMCHHRHKSSEYMSRWIETKNKFNELKSEKNDK